MDQVDDYFYLFVQRVFENTSSKPLIQTLLDNGFDQWEQTKDLNEQLLEEIGVESEDAKIIVEILEDLLNMEQQQSKNQQQQTGQQTMKQDKIVLSIDILLKSLNKKKDFTKKPQKYQYGVNTEQKQKEESLQTSTVLSLNNKKIDELSKSIHICQSLQILHIYENNLKKLEYLEPLFNLRIINAQSNQIQQADCLKFLPNLEKLYLDKNCMTNLPILPSNINLLSISGQKINKAFEFSEEALEACYQSLQIIICESSKVEEISSFRILQACENVNLKYNNIKTFDGIEVALETMQSLRDLDLRGNPITSVHKYRDRVVLLSRSIGKQFNFLFLQNAWILKTFCSMRDNF